MSTSTAELNLILRAQNLARSAIGDVGGAVETIATKARNAGDQLSAAFAGKGAVIARELGNLTTALLSGQDFASAGLMLGATLAGGVVTAFGEKVIAQITGSALFATITGALSAAGTAIGSIITAAIPIGMAAAPFLLLAAIVGAIGFLVTHPDIVAKVAEVVGTIVTGLVGGLVDLGAKIVKVIAPALGGLVSTVAGIVGSLVGAFFGIPGAIAQKIFDGITAIVGWLLNAVRGLLDWFKRSIEQDPKYAGWTYAQAHGLAGPPAPPPAQPSAQTIGRIRQVTVPLMLNGREVGRLTDARAVTESIGAGNYFRLEDRS